MTINNILENNNNILE